MDENLEIVRKVTEDALIFAFALAFAATVVGLISSLPPIGIAICRTAALSGAFAATLLTGTRRNFFSFAFWAVATIVGAIGYFTWLLPLLV
ncbi:MAG: hypothetical protein AAB548_03205 [Patescibacteria group bacterium]